LIPQEHFSIVGYFSVLHEEDRILNEWRMMNIAMLRLKEDCEQGFIFPMLGLAFIGPDA